MKAIRDNLNSCMFDLRDGQTVCTRPNSMCVAERFFGMTESVRTTATNIANRETSSTEIVERWFTRVKQHNPAINAVVTQDEQTALTTALKIDSAINADAIAPSLYGVPLTVKDSFETAGLRTTSSYRPLKNHVPANDATLVSRLKSAGGVILGKTSLPELAGNPYCWSPIFGSTNNPWDTSLTSGGSSGGSAAAVAMGFSMLTLEAI